MFLSSEKYLKKDDHFCQIKRFDLIMNLYNDDLVKKDQLTKNHNT